ncbi:hypothetical protein K438DRAFT_1973695 [Mycena galopus ATCC 62051]|nr:hypothetical protein K438DRAFT_1973695 [Mycena galopus ATCC 62051]
MSSTRRKLLELLFRPANTSVAAQGATSSSRQDLLGPFRCIPKTYLRGVWRGRQRKRCQNLRNVYLLNANVPSLSASPGPTYASASTQARGRRDPFHPEISPRYRGHNSEVQLSSAVSSLVSTAPATAPAAGSKRKRVKDVPPSADTAVAPADANPTKRKRIAAVVPADADAPDADAPDADAPDADAPASSRSATTADALGPAPTAGSAAPTAVSAPADLLQSILQMLTPEQLQQALVMKRGAV